MVLQKRLDYGFNGYQVPPIPRATRSARRRGSFKKKHEENQMRAFDLLAIVAGNLLLEKESTPSSSNSSAGNDRCTVVNNAVKNEWHDEEKPLNVEAGNQGSFARSFFVSNPSQAHQDICSSKETRFCQNDPNLGLVSPITTSEFAESYNNKNLENGESKNKIASLTSKVEVGSSGYKEFGDCKLEVETKRLVKDEPHMSGNLLSSTVANMCGSEDPVVLDGKPPALVSSDSSAKVPLCGNHIPNSSYPSNWDAVNVNVISRDDDENSSGCTHPSTTKKFFRPTPRIGDRRIRKILASKYWKGAPKLKDATLSNSDGDLKPAYRKTKNSYRHQRSEKIYRSERIYPFKKRKHFGYSSPSSSDGGMNCGFVSDSSQKHSIGDASGSRPKMLGVSGTSSSVLGQHNSFQPRDSHVKLRIKSFRVPELLIEIPENATVGSLKRTVMEAVTAILGGGLHVGVLLQGKKVRDDNKTLLQTGISHNNQLDALGFSLEPNDPPQSSPSLHPGEPPYPLQCDTPQPLSRYPPTASMVHQDSYTGSPEPHMNNLGNCIESDHDSAPSPTDTLINKSTTNSKALVAVPAMNVEALAVVPAHRKSKRAEIVQRRIRRPFSVAEVEALVQAVEKLGTGRWRDVKLRAFDNAKHRTYVDLKDKWKTLVHTARIAPQQRRGEPVPQELLDRVLTAHAYWSQQQAKLQLKQQQQQQQPETCLLL